MAYDNRPTEAQIGTLFSWIRWEMPNAQASMAVKWLQNNATRREVSAEMARIKALKDKRALNAENCFEGAIWKNYQH